VLAASVAEEAAYRGVAMSILWYATGNPYLSAVLCSLAFAVAHAVQGWRSGLTIYLVALVMHGLVWFTSSLVPAMIVHALYDFIAGWAIRREAMANEAAPPD
jgi:membrane protease YdiL (CAAX protease family)